MNHPQFWQYFGVFSAACAVVMFGLALWGRREKRRDRAMDLESLLRAWGFTQFARLLRAYAVGNYLGANSITRVTHEIIDELLDGGLPNMLRKVGWNVVKGVFLKNPDDRRKLEQMLAETDFVDDEDEAPTPSV